MVLRFSHYLIGFVLLQEKPEKELMALKPNVKGFPQVFQTHIAMPFYSKDDHFTKTGSGQT
jgi:hypothetical protein